MPTLEVMPGVIARGDDAHRFLIEVNLTKSVTERDLSMDMILDWITFNLCILGIGTFFIGIMLAVMIPVAKKGIEIEAKRIAQIEEDREALHQIAKSTRYLEKLIDN